MRAVTLLGMSGAGKTHFSQRLADWGWTHYSCDLEIGTKYLAQYLDTPIKVDDLSSLSRFIGQVGRVDLGGLSLDEFKRRQQLYYDAECRSLEAMTELVVQSETNFVNDSTGSFCEINDEVLIARVAEKGLLVYIETDAAIHAEVIKRAAAEPKPLYFPADQFDHWLEEFCDGFNTRPDQIVPNEFSAWVFPKLFQSRLPKYERLAAEYGVKVQAKDLHACGDEAAFLEVINSN